MTEPPDGSICIGCGLCCDGTLLGHLAVSDQSDLGAPLQLLGVSIIAAADPPVFELPCPAVEDGRCTIHHLHRPQACAQFECALSAAVQRGDIPAAAARDVIATTLRVRAAVTVGEAPAEVLERQLDEHFRGRIGP